MGKTIIHTDQAPAAIGAYSQAVRAGDFVYISGQIPLDPQTMQIVSEQFEPQARQVLKNLQAVAKEAGGSLQDAVKLMVYVVDLANFQSLNSVMEEVLQKPYPARAAVQVSALPKEVLVEIDAVLYLPESAEA